MTAKKISSRDSVTILLAGLTLIIMILALVSMVNYYQFLPALARFEVRLSSMDWRLVDQNTNTPTLEITSANFTMMNPTSYNGLKMELFSTSLDITAQGTIIPQGSLPYQLVTFPLDPGKQITLSLRAFNATPTAANLANRSNPNLQFAFYPRFTVGTFLDKAGTLELTYQCTSTGGPQLCQQSAITLRTSGLPSGGGGGA